MPVRVPLFKLFQHSNMNAAIQLVTLHHVILECFSNCSILNYHVVLWMKLAIQEALCSFPNVPPSSLPFNPLTLHEIACDPLLIARHFWNISELKGAQK